MIAVSRLLDRLTVLAFAALIVGTIVGVAFLVGLRGIPPSDALLGENAGVIPQLFHTFWALEVGSYSIGTLAAWFLGLLFAFMALRLVRRVVSMG